MYLSFPENLFNECGKSGSIDMAHSQLQHLLSAFSVVGLDATNCCSLPTWRGAVHLQVFEAGEQYLGHGEVAVVPTSFMVVGRDHPTDMLDQPWLI